MTPASPFFRPDIEGLRAVAVLLVIAAHYGVPGLATGFIGVDIFFVISGYLISSILVREHESTGRIELKRFYVNRLRRLLPALLIVLVCTSLAVAWLLPPSVQPAQSQAAIAAALWASNLLFGFDQLDYFAAGVTSNAFLHTWSLGVEEQFYLVWPLLLLFVLSRARDRKRQLANFWLGTTALSLLLCLAWAYTEQSMLAFYMMPARAWQFAAGALAWWCVRWRPASAQQATAGSWVGAALISMSLITITPRTTYPSLWALLPTLGSAALLWAGGSKPRTPTVNVALGTPPMQAIGRLSYSWYLWHWPALLIGQHLQKLYGHPEHAPLALFAALLASLLAAILTHHLIENPIRFGPPARLRPGVQLLLAAGLMSVASHQFIKWHGNAQQWLAQHGSTPTLSAAADLPLIYQHGCDASFRSDTLNPCTYGNKNAAKTAILIGDSVGVQWFPTIAKIHDLDEWKIVVLTKSSCPVVDEPLYSLRMGREFKECTTWRNRAIEWIRQNPAQRLFIGSTRYDDFNTRQWTQGTQRILESLAPYTQAIYIIEPTPSLPFSGPDCLEQRQPDQCQARFNDPRHVPTVTALQEAAELHANVHWLATAEFVCPKGRCQAQRQVAGKDIVVYRDEQHITASFAVTAAPHFLAQLRD